MAQRIIFTAPAWHLSGVNTMTAKLAHALNERGCETEILLTQSSEPREDSYRIDGNLHFTALPVREDASFPRRWRALREYLTRAAPCVYFPGYDFENSTVCPALPPSVATIGVLHSDEPHYYEMLDRVGETWNRIVGVSQYLADEVIRRHPGWQERVRHIPYGVDIPSEAPRARETDGPLRVVVAGRISRYQKRIQDLAPLLDALETLGAQVAVTVVGGGPDEDAMRTACQRHIEDGRLRFAGSLPNREALALFESQDVILMLSEFEGLPLVLLEAMGRGCIPVTSTIRSGIPELVLEGKTGFQFPIGDTSTCAEILNRLATDRSQLPALSRTAHAHMAEGAFLTATMTGAYAREIEAVLAEARDENGPGRSGKMRPPPQLSTARRIRTRVSGTIRGIFGQERKEARR